MLDAIETLLLETGSLVADMWDDVEERFLTGDGTKESEDSLFEDVDESKEGL